MTLSGAIHKAGQQYPMIEMAQSWEPFQIYPKVSFFRPLKQKKYFADFGAKPGYFCLAPLAWEGQTWCPFRSADMEWWWSLGCWAEVPDSSQKVRVNMRCASWWPMTIGIGLQESEGLRGPHLHHFPSVGCSGQSPEAGVTGFKSWGAPDPWGFG